MEDTKTPAAPSVKDATPEQRTAAAAMLGSIKTAKKAASSAENGKKGGRPKGTPQSPETRAKIAAARRKTPEAAQ